MSKIGKIKTIVSTLGIIAFFLGVWVFYSGCSSCDGNDDPPPNPAATTPANAPATTTQQPAETNLSVDPSTVQSDTKSSATGPGMTGGPGGGSSCPYLYTWNGTSYILDNDIIPFKDPSLENTDYYSIQQALKPEDGYYKVRISEELPETSYLDSVQLITVDHPSTVEVYPDLKGKIFNISNSKPLLSCIDSQGNDCLGMLKGREEVYTPGTYFEGSQGEYIIADFGNLSDKKIIKLVVTSDGPVDTSPIQGLNSSSCGKSIRIDSLVTEDGTTRWETRFVFTPHELWATNVFDITNVLPDASGEYKLRFYFTNTHKVDFIGIDTTPEIEKEVHELAPVYAKAGEDVLSRVADTDGKYIVMKKGDELFLKFPYQPTSDRSNFKRDFVFVSRGYFIPDQK